MRALLTIGVLALALGGCGDDHDDDHGHETEVALAEHESAAEPYDEYIYEGPSAEEVPVAEDFAAEAQASINATNYQEALDALEAEIEAE